MKLYAATICGAQDLERQLTELVADRAFLDENPSPANADEFARLLARGRERTGLAVQEVVGLVHPLLEAYHQARLGLEEARSPNWQYAVADMRAQLDRLASPAFLADTPWTWLQHYPRYLRAIKTRLEKLASSGWRRDRQSYEQLAPFLESYDHRAEEHARRGVYDAELQYFRWMLEEFRVSLFAQELGTSFTISAKRLEKQWSKVQA
jgi:ATP-dependent helicase HrpA